MVCTVLAYSAYIRGAQVWLFATVSRGIPQR
jgi:hypothetical protein